MLQYLNLSKNLRENILAILAGSHTHDQLNRLIAVSHTLAKILRNIKIAIISLKNFTEVERFGEPCIVPSLCDTLEDFPAIEREFLEQQFIKHTTGREHIPELLAKLSLFLREQNERCRIIPFVMTGILFRTIYTCRQDFPDQMVAVDTELVASDTSTIIKTVCNDVMKKN